MAMVSGFFSSAAGMMMIFLALIFGDVLCKEVYSSNRSTFPGRRVGGGTRGECSARILVHLVPENSVFAPGATGILGLVQGPATNPVSLELSFQPEGVGSATTRTLPAASASLTSSAELISPFPPSGNQLITVKPVKASTACKTLSLLPSQPFLLYSACFFRTLSPSISQFKKL